MSDSRLYTCCRCGIRRRADTRPGRNQLCRDCCYVLHHMHELDAWTTPTTKEHQP